MAQSRSVDNFPTDKFLPCGKTSTPPRVTSPVVLLSVGSFSPITNLHLFIFETARNHLFLENEAEVIGGIMSPVHASYGKTSVTSVSAEHRWNMCQAAASTSNWIAAANWELQQPEWSRSRVAIEAYSAGLNAKRRQQGLPDVRLMLLCGADLLGSFTEHDVWDPEDLKVLLGDRFGVVVIGRGDMDTDKMIKEDELMSQNAQNIFVVPQRIQNTISSSKVRANLERGLSIKYLCPDPVIEYIYRHNMYKSEGTPKSTRGNVQGKARARGKKKKKGKRKGKAKTRQGKTK